MWEKVIIHSHIDNCYVQIEELMCPYLKNVPMVICQDDVGETKVLAFNQKAATFNICLGESIKSAYKKCSNLFVVHPHYEDYLFYTEEIKNVYREYTNYVENDDLDDAWIDLTSSQGLFGGNPILIAQEIQQRIYHEFGMTVSMGISFDKLFAKLANEHKTAMSFQIASQKNYQDVIYPLAIEKLEIKDRLILAELKSRNYLTIGDIAQCSKEHLQNILGQKGVMIWMMANGQEIFQRRFSHEMRCPQSIGNGMCLPYELKTFDDIKFVFHILSQTISTRLNDYGLKGSVVVIHIKNNELDHYVNKKVLKSAIYTSSDILKIAEELLLEDWFENYQKYIGKTQCRISLSIRQLADVTNDSVVQHDSEWQILTCGFKERFHGCLGWYNDLKEAQPQWS